MSTEEGLGTPEKVELRRSRTDKVIGGVAGGLGHYLGIDPVVVRIGFVVLLFAGPGFLLYILAWILIPEGREGEVTARTDMATSMAARTVVGGLLIVAGSFWLVSVLIPWDWWDEVSGPAVLIAIGAGVLVYGARR
ncbi:MAG: PspC domain-containing protein [Acidimicrobiia bacterium]|nr:PspC domain-containing protein [Acidimicrobiia bacterium]